MSAKQRSSRKGPYFAFLIFVLLASAGTLAIAAPAYVRRQAVARAAEQGVTLSVTDARIGFGEVTLLGVAATIPEVPGAHASVEEVTVSLSGLDPDSLATSGLEIALQGDARILNAAFARYRAAHPLLGAGTIKRISMQSAHILWLKPVGEASRIEGTDASGELTCDVGVAAAPCDPKGHLTIGKLVTTLGAGKELGPWRLDVDRTPSELKLVLALDPANPALATVTAVHDPKDTKSSLDLKIGRTPLKALGIAPSILSLPGAAADEILVEAAVHLGAGKPASSDGAVSFSVEHLRVPGMPGPTTAKIHLAWDGDPRQPMALKDGTFALGPFEGTVRGTLLPFEGGFRLDSSLESRAVPCSALAAQSMETSLGSALGASLGALAVAGGLTKAVTGTAEISGVVFLDTRDIPGARFTVVPKTSCGLSIFSGPDPFGLGK